METFERDKVIKECKYRLYCIKREMIILKKESKILRKTLNTLEGVNYEGRNRKK